MGTAILHIHSTFSDGMCSVGELLDEVDANSDVSVIGITDHDDCRSFDSAMSWKAEHPDSRVQPVWGAEITTFGFTHVLAFKMRPPFPTELPKKFLSLPETVGQLREMGCYVVAPHVDAPMVGIGRRQLAQVGHQYGFFGYELLTPYFTPAKSVPALRALGEETDLLALGGPDAHFSQDLYRVLLRFPGESATDFEASWHDRTVRPESGRDGPKKPLGLQLRQQRRSLIGQPSEQMSAWVRRRIRPQGKRPTSTQT